MTARRFAVRVSETVTVARSPSGTLATIIPIAKTRALTTVYVLRATPRNTTPRVIAMAEMMMMKW